MVLFYFLQGFLYENRTSYQHQTVLPSLTKSNNEFWHFPLVSTAPLRVMLWESGGRRASREAGWCLSWKAAHKPNVKHHSTHSPPGPAFIPGCRQGAQPADGCSKSLLPLVPVFQHAQENKGERKWWHMDLFKRKEKSRGTMLSTAQNSFSSLPWVGGVPNGHSQSRQDGNSLFTQPRPALPRAGAAEDASCQTPASEGLQSWLLSTNTPAVSPRIFRSVFLQCL